VKRIDYESPVSNSLYGQLAADVNSILPHSLCRSETVNAPAKPLYSYGLCNRIDIIYFDEIAKIESLIENVQNFDQHQV
jgi:hypothetical protein